MRVHQGVVDGGATGLAVGAVNTTTFTQVTNIVPAPADHAVNTVEYASRLLVTHRARLGSLRGFSEFLGETRLPFVAPPRGDPAHPEQVWREVQRAPPGGGVLLTGAGGVGKTRCAVEVAELAERSGWKVVWLRDAEHTPTVVMLAAAIDAAVDGLSEHDTLLVLDYVDQMVGLSLEQLSRHFSASDNRVRLLATSRPLRSDHLSRNLPLSNVVVSPPAEHRRALISLMLRQAAPKTLARLGDTVLVQICGERPIIALLIARVLEEREESGALTEEFLAHARARGRELFLWLDRRLSAFVQDLGASFGDTIETKRKLDRLVAAILALTPLALSDLQAAARRVAERLGMQRDDADDLIALLHETGWLEGDPVRELWVVHDVVADQALEVALTADRASERQRVLGEVLAGVSEGARELGRVATSLSRAAVSGEERFRQRLDVDARAWWNANVGGLAAIIADDYHDIAGYALGSLLKRTPWQAFVLERWNDLLGPWLVLHVRAAGARHVIYLGLRHVRTSAFRMFEAARTWLETNGLDPNASFVLASLLEHPEVPGEVLHETSGRAQAWLGEYGLEEDAKYVLRALLVQRRLDTAAASAARESALAWLQEYGAGQSASFVLSSLLCHKALKGNAARAASTWALTWLKNHWRSEAAWHVFRALLARPRQDADLARAANVLALTWLQELEGRENPGPRVRALLGQPGLDEATARAARELALTWLREHAGEADASTAIAALLGPRIPAETVYEVSAWALAWLQEYGTEKDASFVLSALLERTQRYDEHDGDDAVQATITQGTLTEETTTATRARALAWLAIHGEDEEASFVLSPLLWQQSLDEATAREAIARAFAWLEAYGKLKNASYVIPALLRNRCLVGEAADEAVERALAWLGLHWEDENACYVIRAVLAGRTLADAMLREACDRAYAWLKRHGSERHAEYVIRSVLRHERPPLCFAHIEAWMALHRHSDEAYHMAIAVLRYEEIDDDRWRVFADIVCERLNREHPTRSEFRALTALSSRLHLIAGSRDGELSTRGANDPPARATEWDDLRRVHEANGRIRGEVVAQVKGGLSVKLDSGVKGFLPATLSAVRSLLELPHLVGRVLDFTIVSINPLITRLILSRREIVVAERSAALVRLREGDVVEGVVVDVSPKRVLVDLGGVDGIVRATDMSWDRFDGLSALATPGERITVKILELTRPRVVLGFKQLKPDPWSDVDQRYHVGALVSGTVVALKQGTAHIRLEPGVEGVMHVSNISWFRRVSLGKLFTVGETVRALVLAVATSERCIVLGMKQLQVNPFEAAVARYAPGKAVEGCVENVADFGVFVELEPGISGLFHINEMGAARAGRHPREMFRKGDSVRATVLKIEYADERLRIALGPERLERPE